MARTCVALQSKSYSDFAQFGQAFLSGRKPPTEPIIRIIMLGVDLPVNYTGERIGDAVAQFIRNTRPLLPYAGVAIGTAIDGSLLSAIYPDRTGANQLFSDALSPHLGANLDAMA